jgi:tetratricopeptide (TPR) repeat protein
VRKITALAITWVAAAAFGEAAWADQRLDDARQAQRRGAELHSQGDLQGALREFDRAVGLAPEAPLAWVNRGLVHRALKNCPAAIEDFSRALKLQPDYFNALYQRAACLAATGAAQRALEDYTRAIGLPGRIDARFIAFYGRGDVYRRLGRLEEAAADYSAVLAMRTDTTALRSRAWVSFYRGLWSDAFNDAARYLHDTEGKEPDAAYAVILGVLALRRGGDMQQARKFLQQWSDRVNAPRWPAAILAYLDTGAHAALLVLANDPGEITEARAYVGVNLIALREIPQGTAFLRQVVRDGEPSYLEYDLAYHELRRLGLARPQDHKRWPAS